MDSVSALERNRDRLMQQLLDTVALIGRLQAEAVPVQQELETAKQELERRMEAMKEVEQLVGGER